jgi:hypothetical protein
MGTVWSIVIGLVVVGVYLFLTRKRKVKKIKYVEGPKPVLNADELMFYTLLASHGQKPLILDKTATIEARRFSKYANNFKVTSHVGILDRVAALEKIGAVNVSEVYAGGFQQISTTVVRLLESPSHAKVIKSDYTHVGVGVVGKHCTAIYFKIK